MSLEDMEPQEMIWWAHDTLYDAREFVRELSQRRELPQDLDMAALAVEQRISGALAALVPLVEWAEWDLSEV